jgi:predicted ATPase/DNA-binding SARP family transcriptional activator/DNA-binding CsgD family transcriptional regulator
MNAETASDPSRKHRSSSESPFPIRVRLLGGFGVWVGPRAVGEGAWHLRKAKSLVTLLALAPGHRLHREQMRDLLWPDSGREAAANNLRQTLHAARRTLDPAVGSHYLASQNESLVLCPEGSLWVDVEAFEQAARTARRSREPAAYEAAIDLYAGELLPADRYEEWAEQHRTRLREMYLSLLLGLARLQEERADYESATEALSRLISEEPTREEAHVGLMRLYALLGSKGEALAQYDSLKEALSRELGTEPAASSRALREEIAAGRFPTREAPPLGSPSKRPSGAGKHNLSAPRTSFVGRERELMEVKRALSMTRLLTLTGTGGSGKTRLALEVARHLVGAYQDGVWLVELAGLSDSELVPQAVAGALGVRDQPGQQLIDVLVEALCDKETLLILDNCEHLVEATARLVDVLLDTCPRLRGLATSREALDIAGEVRWTVPSLSVLDPRLPPTVGKLEGSESARLFVERASDRRPDFALVPDNAGAVAEICRRLDGIPLAIELAAARVGTLSVEQISERLMDSLKLLTSGERTAAPRHRTLRGALNWSYELLNEQEQVFFRRLSTFMGGWTLEAVEAVVSGDGVEEGNVLDLLSGLVDKSLVVADATGEGGVRYRLLEPIRQYASEKLEERGEAEAIKRRHAAFYLALAERVYPELRGPGQVKGLHRLMQENDNLRAAMAWLLSEGDTETAARLGWSLWPLWWFRGQHREGRRLMEAVLESESELPPVLQIRANVAAGLMVYGQADMETTERYAKKLIRLSRLATVLRERREAWTPPSILEGAATAGMHVSKNLLPAEKLGDYEARSTQLGDYYVNFESIPAGLSAPEFFTGLHHDACQCEHWGYVFKGRFKLSYTDGSEDVVSAGEAYFARPGHAFEALEDCETVEFTPKESFEQLRRRITYAEAYGRTGLGMVAMNRMNYEEAMAQLEEALPLCLECGEVWLAAQIHTFLGIVLLLQGNHDRATPRFEEGLAMAREVGDRIGVYNALYNLALVALIQGKYELANSRFGEGIALSRQMEDQANIAYCLEGLAAVAGMQGKVERSVHLFGAAEGLLEALGVPVWTFYQPDRSLYERTIADLRGLLGEAAFEEAWADGRATTLDDAIEYALAAGERAATSAREQPPADRQPIPLTRREKEVAALVARDLTNRQIAKELVVSERTVEKHVANILKKLGLHSREQVDASMMTERRA